MSLSMRKVRIQFPSRSNLTHCSQRLATAAMFLRSCVVQALSSRVGPRHLLPCFGTTASVTKRVSCNEDLIQFFVRSHGYCRHTAFKETPTYYVLCCSIYDKNAVQAKHIRKVGLPVLLHRIVMKVSRD